MAAFILKLYILLMRKLCLLVVLQCAAFTLSAQTCVLIHGKEPVNPKKDKIELQGYIIKVMQALPIPQSPLLSPKEIQINDDADKVAQWMIREYRKTGHFHPFRPSHAARELGISIHPKFRNS